MQQASETMCPVCTLYLRPGITLKQHLASHPKQKVIDALVKLSILDDVPKGQQSDNVNVPEVSVPGTIQTQNMGPYINQVALSHQPNIPGNHFFMYQQSMSTSSPHQTNVSPLPFNPFAQQYLVPTIYNPQMMPYFYQQQQLIMSSNGMPPPVRALPFDMSVNNSGQGPSTETRPSDLSVKSKDKDGEENIEKSKTEDKEGSERTNDMQMEEEESLKIDLKEQDLMSDHNEEEEECSREESSSLYKNDQDSDERVESAFSHNENSSDHDYEAHMQEIESQYLANNLIDHEECIGRPASQRSSNSEWAFRPDLNKACQTQNSLNISPRSVSHNEESSMLSESRSNYFFVDHKSNVSSTFSSEEQHSYEQAEPIYTSANIINNTEGLEFMSMEEIEGMQVIIGDFSNSSLIPAPENYDSVRPENPPILMTISGVSVMSPNPNNGNMELLEHSILGNSIEDNSIGNVNIRSDEKMPPRGELSGQESMGSTSDVAWNHIQQYQEQNSVSMGSYEHNPWDNSQERNSYIEESDSKLNMSTVDMTALKEELAEGVAGCKSNSKYVGLDINRKKVKKLIIKPKKPIKETQTKFDHVFTNGLKVENTEEDVDNLGLDNKEDIKEETKLSVINICRSCDKIFKTKKELRMHNREFHRQTKLKVTKCQICDEVFDMEHKFNEHLKIHPLECRMCGKLFYRRQGLKLHTARHLGIKPFKCDLCDKAFLVKQKLEEHRNCHTGNSPIKCSMCPETFKRHSNLVQHRNKHHFMIKRKIKDYICFCGEVFHSKKKLAWHKEIHDSKPKACTQCSEKFIHMASLTRHMRRAHNAEYLPDDRNPTQSNTECPICKGIYLKTSLDAHLKTHTSQKPFNCSICNKEFTTKWNLKLHKWTHASRTQKPFKCELCKGAFIRENDYISHMNSHKSLRPYTCNYCGAQFIRKYNCQRHVKEHENDKTYNCTVCGKSFHRSYYLKDHMRVHSGDRPYSCHICGKTSTTKSNHNKHVQIHHAREPVSTEN
ncbi:hypothetical protein ABEB36_012363 [Hypothenemus hampei]|uniref:C2H2-type domain-containing protein n=1 Tax=Hypothenemus hampei TaxID=57062 RepID=A0ABD1EAY3_HYPHA